MELQQAVGILGGSFDPIHHGHLRSALDVCDSLALDGIHLLPNFISPHKSISHASDHHRLAMLTLAIEDCEKLRIDPQELNSNTSCFTIDTLEKLRLSHPTSPLCFLMGMDSLRSFTHWHRWQDILDLCHLVVSARPGWDLPTDGDVAQLLTQRQVNEPSALHQQLAGKIYLHQAYPLAISSSEIRELCRREKSIKFLVPNNVQQYISKHQLYRLPVSDK